MISVIIPTYNPNISRLIQTISALKNQTLDFTQWELLIIDNNSTTKFDHQIDLSWHLNAKIVFEGRQGLTFARLKGFSSSNGNLVVLVDDDNILQKDFLLKVNEIFESYQTVGAIGGNIVPLFDIEPPTWTKQFWGKLAIRDLGQSIKISDFKSSEKIDHYPDFAPVGAGMAVRREALKLYIVEIEKLSGAISDRSGDNLSSSGDNEIVVNVLKSGFEVGFFPDLQLGHLIPSSRLTKEYLSRLNYGIMNSWTGFRIKYKLGTFKLIKKWTVPFRKVKSYFMYRAWAKNENFINWKGSCGIFDALAK